MSEYIRSKGLGKDRKKERYSKYSKTWMAWDTLSFRINVSHEAAELSITSLFAWLVSQPQGPGGKAELAGTMKDS